MSNSIENDSLELFPSEISQKSSGKLWPTPRAGDPGSRKLGTGGRVLREEAKRDILSPVVFPARISVSQEKGRASKDLGLVFGLPCLSQLGYYDRDLQLLRTLEQSLFEDSTPCLEHLPKSGMMRNGKIYVQATWVLRTEGRESGLFAMPSVMDTRTDIRKPEERSDRANKGGCANLREQVRLWPTPTGDSVADRKKKYEQGGTPLTLAVKMWPTPSAEMAGEGELLNNLQTKEGEKAKPGERAYNPKTGNHVQVTLNRAVKMWPTIRASEYKGADPLGSKSHKHMLKRQYLSATVQEVDQASGSLSPKWVDWLMGYPIGWTDLKDSEMQLSLK